MEPMLAIVCRAHLLPEFYNVMVMLAGVQAPGIKRSDGAKEVVEPFARESKLFTEARLLNREVNLVVEGSDKYGNILGAVQHPAGNISEVLLTEGLAKVADWSLQYTPSTAAALRAAEAKAKASRQRVWRDYVPRASTGTGEFQGKVVEIVSADILIVQDVNGSERRIGLSSIRVPKLGRRDTAPEPFATHAKELVRSKAIGQKVRVDVEYVRAIPNSERETERSFASVYVGQTNLAVALVDAGYARVVQHRGDEERSSEYDALLAAEQAAKDAKRGVHYESQPVPVRVTDLTTKEGKTKSTSFLSGYQRKGRMRAVCDFVVNGTRLKLLVGGHQSGQLITVALGGVRCPQGSRLGTPGEPFGDEASAFTKELVFQQDVEVEIQDIDRSGSFVGSVFIKGRNLATLLLEDGLAWIAGAFSVTSDMTTAEERCKAAEKKIWKDFAKQQEERLAAAAESGAEGLGGAQHTEVRASDIFDGTTLYVQLAKDAAHIDTLTEKMKAFSEWAKIQPADADFKYKVGEVYGGLYAEDGLWYRVRVENRTPEGYDVLFIDYGNRSFLTAANLRDVSAPQCDFPKVDEIGPIATEFRLAFVKGMRDDDDDLREDAGYHLKGLIWDQPLSVKVEYSVGKQQVCNPSANSVWTGRAVLACCAGGRVGGALVCVRASVYLA